jgi:diguanylate cyclase (GGDEF)-like protein
VEFEKCVNEKNDLEVEYRQRGESVSIFFEKYSTYYNLRKLAEDFAARVSLTELSQLVVIRALEFIPKGDGCFLALAAPSEEKLSLVASKRFKEAGRLRRKEGDLFDFWVIRNRKRLLVTDTQKDFRFDTRAALAHGEAIRSLISAPLLYEGRVLGTLRLHSAKSETFTADDLRLLDAIATLASAALSNAMLFEKTQELAIRDSLTGLYVQRYFFERLREEHRRALKSGHSLTLLMCDLDHFKAANDRWGHGAGDLMLVRFAEILREKVEGGVVARYGGEEFAVLLSETGKEKAAALAEQIREAMERHPFTIRREKVQTTVSIGVANLPADTLDEEELIRKADEALYRAKREGRNRVVSWALR